MKACQLFAIFAIYCQIYFNNVLTSHLKSLYLHIKSEVITLVYNTFFSKVLIIPNQYTDSYWIWRHYVFICKTVERFN